MVSVRIGGLNLAPFIFTAIYASNRKEERDLLWKNLEILHTTHQLYSYPWLLAGDFNEITHPSENSITTPIDLLPQMMDFKKCLDCLEVKDMRFHGPLFTWTNKRFLGPIGKKLDRTLINEAWFTAYPQSLALFLAPEISDHCPYLIDLATINPSSGTKPFKFFNYLRAHHDFLPTVTAAWLSIGIEDHTLSTMSKKQKALKRALKTLNSNNFSQIQKRVSETNSLLKIAQVQALHQPDETHFQEERNCQIILSKLKEVEEAYFKQKSKINWLQLDDQNISYFHKVIMARTAYNLIHTLTAMHGRVVVDHLTMGNIGLEHFISILGPHVSPPSAYVLPEVH